MQSKNLPVLYFHSVNLVKDSDWYKSYLTVSLSLFEKLLEYFRSKRYSFVTLDELFEHDASRRDRKTICLTFDDGYLDNYVYVYPLLKKYRAKGTIFVSPEFVQPDNAVRNTLEDVWNGSIKSSELVSSGFLSWEEMRIMQNSGHVDIQSHTMTHTKYYKDSFIREFHNPRSDYLYPIANRFPERKPYYITDSEFKKLLPYGTPFFSEGSSLITQIVSINPDFENMCVDLLSEVKWARYSHKECLDLVKDLYNTYRNSENMIIEVESTEQYEKRIWDEIADSKSIIEKELQKEVNHICWPHGDYTSQCRDMAFQAGYQSTHVVQGKGPAPKDRSFQRIGVVDHSRSELLSFFRTVVKTQAYRGIFPYSQFHRLYRLISHSRK